MPRYFFHVRKPGGTVQDLEGIGLPSETAARTEAIKAARDIMAEHIHKGLDVSGWSFEIADEDGRHVTTVPFSEAIRRADA